MNATKLPTFVNWISTSTYLGEQVLLIYLSGLIDMDFELQAPTCTGRQVKNQIYTWKFDSLVDQVVDPAGH